jgi:hypothetical protein
MLGLKRQLSKDLPLVCQGRVLLDLISEPDIFDLEWADVATRRGFQYPPLPDLYGPTMQVSNSVVVAGNRHATEQSRSRNGAGHGQQPAGQSSISAVSEYGAQIPYRPI